MKIALAQINLHVGNIEKNVKHVVEIIRSLEDKADLIVFPELTLCGYPPEDLLLRTSFYKDCENALQQIKNISTKSAVIVGYPEKIDKKNYNAAAVIQHQKIIASYQKQKLPNYTVFDEKRYFKKGHQSCVFNLHGIKIGLLICEDFWNEEPIKNAKAAGAEIIIAINASPYHHEQADKRLMLLKKHSEIALPIFYVNCIGGQDELIFDGGSFVANAKSEVCALAKYFEEDILLIEVEKNTETYIHKQPLPKALTWEEKSYSALKLGVKDYLAKNKFSGALIGLSGGVDSALTLTIAADAIGPKNVSAIIMPSEFTNEISIEDAVAEAKSLGVHYEIIPIKDIYHFYLHTLTPYFNGNPADATEENLQARIRGMILMALSNKTGKIVLTTGNKSEMAVGYCTLYGDMAGGFAVIKDVFKTDVYRLSHYRNSLSPVIPERVLTRAPTAELKHNQTDQDKLPPYDILDRILKYYIEENKSIEDIIAHGFDKAIVDEMIRLVHLNEYKRRQAPIGARLSERAFGRDWRYPISR